MSGWQTIIWGSVCGAGAILFLALVAHSMARATIALDDFEATRKKAAKKRQKPAEEPVVAEAIM